MKNRMKNIYKAIFLVLSLIYAVSCSYMKTDLGDETIDVSITQIKTSSGETGIILSFNTVSTNLVIPEIVQGLPVLKINFSKTTNISSLSSVVIPSSVAEIDTFEKASSLSEISLPDSLAHLPSFKECTSLTEIEIPQKISEIPDSCFENCKSLKKVSKKAAGALPESLEGINAIGKRAFYNCSALTYIALETSSVTKLNESTFCNCTSLSSINLPSTINSVASEVFSSCTSLAEVEGFEQVTSLGDKIFFSCKDLKSIKINPQVEEIPGDMFNGCSSIKSFDISENVKKIGSSAFAGTSLAELFCKAKEPPVIYKTTLPEMKLEEEKQKEENGESQSGETATEGGIEPETEKKYKKVFILYIPAASKSLYEEQWNDFVDWRVIDVKTLEEFEELK